MFIPPASPVSNNDSESPLSELTFQAPPHRRNATPSKASSSVGTHAEASILPLSQLQFPAPPLKRTTITDPDASIALLSQDSEPPLSESIFQAPPHQPKATPSKASSSVETHAEASIPPLSQLRFPAPPLKRTATTDLEASVPPLSQLHFPAPPLRPTTIADPQNIPPISSLSQPTNPLPVFSQRGTESADLTDIQIPQAPLSTLQFPPPPKKHKAKMGAIPHVPRNIVDQPAPPSIIDPTSPPQSTQARIHPESTSPQKTIPTGITMGLGQPSVPASPTKHRHSGHGASIPPADAASSHHEDMDWETTGK